MPKKDNWGTRARIGLFIVSSEVVPEAEWWAMAPPGVSVHAARVAAKSPWAPWNANRSAVILDGDLLRGAQHFAAMQLSSVVLAHTTSSVVGGQGWDNAVVKALEKEIRKGPLAKKTAVTTNGLDTMAALAASGVKRPYIVLPPWFPDDTIAQALTYYTDHGFAPAGHLRYKPAAPWSDLPPGDLYAHGMGFAQEIGSLFTQISGTCPKDADGVLIGGTGFRCVGMIGALEHELGGPVISANQASLWACLRHAGVRDAVPDYGKLFNL